MNELVAGRTLVLALALPFLAALTALLGWRVVGRRVGWFVAAAALATFALLAWLRTGSNWEGWRFAVPWMPAIGVDFALRGDGFGLFLAMLVTGVGVLVALYSIGYLADEPDDRVRRYWPALAAFMGAMVGIALADDLILLFVFWEITSVSSFLLIGYRSDDDQARAGALTALQVTALGGLAMSVGFLLVGQVTGTFSLTAMENHLVVEGLEGSPLVVPALLLILLGAFTKSAQVPFHFWLPRAMVAPTPVSAYLHAATMVKAGVFLVGRMQPLFGASPLWAPLLVGVGGTSMLLGAFQAMRETDLKAILARTTGAALGLMMLVYGVGAGAQDALQMLNHALYKGALFLVAGIVEHRVHTRDLRQLGGLRHALPAACVVCVLAALSMAGVTPLLGFAAKESFYAGLLHAPWLTEHPTVRVLVLVVSVVSSALMTAAAARITLGVFFGATPPSLAHALEHEPHAARPPLWLSPAVLAGTSLTLGLLGAWPPIADAIAAASSTWVWAEHRHLSPIPELQRPLLASALALAIAAVVYRARAVVASFGRDRSPLPAMGDAWDRLLAGVARLAETYSRWWQNGSLRRYLAVTALLLPVLVVHGLHAGGLSYHDIRTTPANLPWYGLLLCVLLAVATMAAVRAETRLAAAIATTSIGFIVSMLFVVYRSPDILLTQILIETVSTIFVLLVLIFMPPFSPRDLTPGLRVTNLGVALAFGLTLVLLLLLAMTPGFRETQNIATMPGGLLSLSLAQGGGANAVNVIIVDIRAMDTNGEITVLVAVGLCIYGLLRTKRSNA